jgi:hypothetical protein
MPGTKAESFLGSVGVRLYRTYLSDGGTVFTPELKLRYVHDFEDDNPVVFASLPGLSPTVFAISGIRPARNFATAGTDHPRRRRKVSPWQLQDQGGSSGLTAGTRLVYSAAPFSRSEGMRMLFTVNGSKVIVERFDDETILINLESGAYYSLDAVGTAIWELAQQASSVQDLLESFECRYVGDAAEMAQGVQQLLEQLQAQGLIQRADVSSGGTAPSEGLPREPRAPYQPPVLARYGDLQDTLALDPIHDVEESGWPAVTPPTVASR